MERQQKIWLITGVSGGLGKAMAQAIYDHGDIVVGTVRKDQDKKVFEESFSKPSRVFQLDVTDLIAVESMVQTVIDQFGKIDFLVNNAGYGLFGLVEEISAHELTTQIEVNVLAPAQLIKSVLPHMRQRKAGHIIQLSSRVGIVGGVGNGAYAASKFAMEGFSEALFQEVKPYGIHVTLVEPGPLRTDFFGRSVVFAAGEIEEYKDHVGNIREKFQAVHGHQSGDPIKVAQLIWELGNMSERPFRVPVTLAAIDALYQKIAEYQKVVDRWKEIAGSVQY